MRDLFIGVLTGIVASYLIKWLEYVFNSDESVDRYSVPSSAYIRKIGMQFYFCFPVAIAMVVWRFFTHAETILATFQIVSASFLFMLSLFAFMCAMDVVYKLSDCKSNSKTDKLE